MTEQTPRSSSGVVEHAVRSSTVALEAAVVLESSGVNDEAVRRGHGAAGVFALVDRRFAGSGPWGPYAPPQWAEPDARTSAAETAPGARRTRWFFLRGLLYAVPAIVAFTLLPAADHVESALLLGGLLLSWAGGYGMTYLAWAYIGNYDEPAAHRFLRRSVLLGTLVALIVAVVAVYASLLMTVTMQVSLWTVLLLVGQTVYLLSAAALLMAGRELRLLVALLPAAAGAGYYAVAGGAAPPPGVSLAAPAVHGPETLFLAASVLLTMVFALEATRDARRPVNRLVEGVTASALQHCAYGLLIGLLVLFPALNELINDNFESLPLTVTLAALPLVVSMGVAEVLLLDNRRQIADLLRSTGSVADFVRAARAVYLVMAGRFAAALTLMTVGLGGLGIALFGFSDLRYLSLGGTYVLLGVAIFAAMVLNTLGRIRLVLPVLGTGVAVLLAGAAGADHTVSDSAAIAWLAAVTAVMAAVLVGIAHRVVSEAASHR